MIGSRLWGKCSHFSDFASYLHFKQQAQYIFWMNLSGCVTLLNPHIIHVRLVIYGAVMVTDNKAKTLGESR